MVHAQRCPLFPSQLSEMQDLGLELEAAYLSSPPLAVPTEGDLGTLAPEAEAVALALQAQNYLRVSRPM